MYIFLGSWAMTFAGLFFVYGAVRSHAGQWPPAGVPVLPVGLPAINTLVIGASSVMLHLWLTGIERRRAVTLVASLTVALAALFGALQIVLWKNIYVDGLRPSEGIYPSVFWALTLFHGLHVLIGLGALGTLLVRSLNGQHSAANHLSLKLWSMYWHFVGLVWFLVFVTVFF